MLKISRHALAFLTTVALASFTSAYAQSPVTPASAAFRENPAWTSSDGVLTTNASGMESALMSRSGLADSLTSFEFRAPKGAQATVFIAGRYAFELEGNGDWQNFSAKFRSPRFDEGYNKSKMRSLSKHASGQRFVATSFSKRRALTPAGTLKTHVGQCSSS